MMIKSMSTPHILKSVFRIVIQNHQVVVTFVCCTVLVRHYLLEEKQLPKAENQRALNGQFRDEGADRLLIILTINKQAGRPGSSEVPRNPLTRWDVSSIPANGIFFTKKLKN